MPVVASPQIGVLGDLDVRLGGRAVAVGGAVPRALLLRLVLAGGATVVDGVLQDDLWDGAPPPSAAGTVQAHVSRLRRALQRAGGGADAQHVVRRGSGYALVLDDDALDARRFERLAARGRSLLDGDPEGAAARLEEALALWRGPALVDVAHRPWAEAEAHRLEQLRVAAREDRVAADLALGRETAAAAGAESLVAANPLRERGWELLALALYRQGRQADALARLRELRDLLAEELGTDPGPAAAGLVRRVLSHDPTLLLAPAAAGAPPAGAGAGTPRALRGSTSNLPVPPSPVVGRRAELGAVAALLRDHRLVTLTGPGGAGKTRLALEAARGRDDADGPWLVPLAGLEDGRLVPAAVGSALGLVLGPGGSTGTTSAAVAEALRDRELLLVLDDCERFVDDVAAAVTDLVALCPRLRVLATSREPLRVDGEHIYEVPVLSGGPDGDAVELFLARAAAAAPGWRPSGRDREDVARVCDALDGLPLAVELSAAQLRALSLGDLLGMLDDHDALLRGGRRSSSRHATMQGTIAWSYDRLDPVEQQLLTGLSVFAGGFDLAAAQEVLGRRDVVVVLPDLVARSLVSVSPPGRPRRFWLLSVVRRFAAARLEPARRAQLAARHVAWVAATAELDPPPVRGLVGGRGTAAVAASGDDVLAALAVAGPADAVRITVGAAWWLYVRAGQGAVATDRLRAALEALDADPAASDDPGVRALGWVCLCLWSHYRGDGATADAAIASAVVAAERSGDLEVRARVLTNRGFWSALAGATAAARADAEAARALVERAGRDVLLADVHLLHGVAALVDGDPATATEHLRRSVAVADRHQHASVSLTARQVLVRVELLRQEPALAWRAALDTVERAGELEEAGVWLASVGALVAALLRVGAGEEAAELAAAMLGLAARTGQHGPELLDADVAGALRDLEASVPPEVRARAAARGAQLSPEAVLRRARELEPAALRAPGAAGSGGVDAAAAVPAPRPAPAGSAGP